VSVAPVNHTKPVGRLSVSKQLDYYAAVTRKLRSDRPRCREHYQLLYFANAISNPYLYNNLDFQYSTCYGHHPYTYAKIEINVQLVQKKQRKQIDGRTRPTALPSPLTRSVEMTTLSVLSSTEGLWTRNDTADAGYYH